MRLDMGIGVTALRRSVYDYVQRGWRVFPVAKYQKVPAIRDWQKGLVPDDWNPDLNIGIVTGRPSGIVVLDVDQKSGGWESLSKLQEEHGDLPDTLGAYTANGGYHFYFVAPAVEVRNGARILGYSGIDIRGDGGYVVAPPSVLEGGLQYRWDPDSAAWLAPLPQYLINRERPREEEAVAEAEFFPQGTRNDSLAKLGGALRRFGLGRGIIEATLLEANQQKCNPPLPEEEVRQIANSIARYEPSFRPGRGASGTSGDSGYGRGRPNGVGLPQERPLRGAGTRRNLRRGAWYLDNRR